MNHQGVIRFRHIVGVGGLFGSDIHSAGRMLLANPLAIAVSAVSAVGHVLFWRREKMLDKKACRYGPLLGIRVKHCSKRRDQWGSISLLKIARAKVAELVGDFQFLNLEFHVC